MNRQLMVQEDQFGALGLVLNAAVLWTTRYLDAAVTALRGLPADRREHEVLYEWLHRRPPRATVPGRRSEPVPSALTTASGWQSKRRPRESWLAQSAHIAAALVQAGSNLISVRCSRVEAACH